MHLLRPVACSLLLAGSALALPDGSPLQARKRCNADNCYRAAVASRAKPGPEQAYADCVSFMAATVTPCQETVTSTYTRLLGSPITVTQVITLSSDRTIDVVSSVPTVLETITDTATVTVPTTVFTEYTIYSPIVFITLNSSASGGMAKRVQATTCAATTQIPSNVPTYASACSGTARYSSACSCRGVTGSASTLPATVTTTFFTNVQGTPIITATTVQIVGPVATRVIRTYVGVTLETTAVTVTVADPTTITSTVTTPYTLYVDPPPPPPTPPPPPPSATYLLQVAAPAALSGSYLQLNQDRFGFTRDRSQAEVILLVGDQITSPYGNTPYVWEAYDGWFSLVYFDSTMYSHRRYLTCSVDDPLPGAAGGVLHCQTRDGTDSFITDPASPGLYIGVQPHYPEGYVDLTLIAIPTQV